jgi:hypothetical protein
MLKLQELNVKNRVALIALSVLAFFLMVSCAKNAASTTSQSPNGRKGAGTGLSLSWGHAMVVVQGAPFYVADSGASASGMVWKAALDFGTVVNALQNVEPRSFDVGGQTLSLQQVQLLPNDNASGTSAQGSVDGAMRSAHLAAYADPAVVTDAQAAVMKEPSASARVLLRLPRMSLVAIVSDSRSGDFVSAVVIDPRTGSRVPTAYIDLRQISFSTEDVRAGVLVAKAMRARTPEEKRAFLQEAERSHPSTAFIEDIRALLAEGKPVEGPATEPLAADLAARAQGARIRSAPTADAEIVATIDPDDVATTISRTVAAFETDAGSAHWYEVTSPVHGWVFGLELEGAD